MRKWIEFIEIAVIVLVLTTVVNTYLFNAYKVYGDSMKPLFSEGDLVLSYKRVNPSQGDIIAFFDESGVINIKKVVAGPSDYVSSDGRKLYVNDAKVGYNKTGEFAYSLANDEFFVLGKNHSVSIDSRHNGPVKEDKVIGKILLKFWPPL
ncbi:signal peptidase I [Proteinivorax hydrogeniformans]|uniref:Signal peptidase I n=1 Tax=Proteinivorax hydrogeniformans TaxID=1826727 RepID=A0AAU8HPD0_9FIRM